MTTLPLNVHTTCPGHSQKGVLLQLTLDLCAEGHRGHVWLCLLILGVLCRCSWAYSAEDLRHLQKCLKGLTHDIQKSDALLYAPAVDEITESCHNLSLSCYMLELKMVLIEEEIESDYCVFHFIVAFNDSLQSYPSSCPPCETTPLRNSTIFLKNLIDLLSKLMSDSSSTK